MLKEFDYVPDWFMNIDAKNLHERVDGSFVIQLKSKGFQSRNRLRAEGHRKSSQLPLTEPLTNKLFISTLLHGNETSGLTLLQNFLHQHDQGKNIPRDLLIFVGNTTAAAQNLRVLPGQTDFNRIWQDDLGDKKLQALREEVLSKALSENGFFAGIDIHNNSGRNPPFGCISKMNHTAIWMASRFSDHTIYFTRPASALSPVLSQYGHAITIECGQSQSPDGMKAAAKFIDEIAHLPTFPSSDLTSKNVKKIAVSITLIPNTKIHWVSPNLSVPTHSTRTTRNRPSAIWIREDLETLNFQTLESGTLIGWFKGDTPPLLLTNDDGEPTSLCDYFVLNDGEIRTSRQLTPCMFTLDTNIIFQDCLGYLMLDA